MSNAIGGPQSKLGQAGFDSVSIEALLRHDAQGGLSIEELVQQCQNRLLETDTAICSMMASQNANSDDQKALARLETVLNRYKDTMGDPNDESGKNAAAIKEIKKAYADAASTIKNDELRNVVAAKANEFNETAKDNCVSKAEVEALIGEVNAQLDALTSGDQMTMIKLQSLVEKRSQTLSMFSNMIAKMEENIKGIIQNMAR